VLNDRDAAIRTYEEMMEDRGYPTHDLARFLQVVRRWSKAEQYYLELIGRGRKSYQTFTNTIVVQVAQGKYAAADSIMRIFEDSLPGNPYAANVRAYLASSRGDYQSAQRIIDSLQHAMRSSSYWRLFTDWRLGDIALLHGKLAESESYYATSKLMHRESGNAVGYIGTTIQNAWRDLWFRNDSSLGVARIDSALAMFPLDSIPPADRPYLGLANFAAAVGDVDKARGWMAQHEAEVDSMARRSYARRRRELEISAILSVSKKRFPEAIEAFRVADSTRENPLAGLANLADAFHRARNADSVIAYCERYLATDWLYRIGNDSFWLSWMYQRLGEYLEDREPERAAEYYNEFVELWKDADPELQPQVEDVRQRIARLVGEGG